MYGPPGMSIENHLLRLKWKSQSCKMSAPSYGLSEQGGLPAVHIPYAISFKQR